MSESPEKFKIPIEGFSSDTEKAEEVPITFIDVKSSEEDASKSAKTDQVHPQKDPEKLRGNIPN